MILQEAEAITNEPCKGYRKGYICERNGKTAVAWQCESDPIWRAEKIITIPTMGISLKGHCHKETKERNGF